jgi:hypothetical protein
MKSYKLTIYNQSRVIEMVLLLPFIIFVSLFSGLEIMPKGYFWIATIPILVGLSGMMYYFVKGDLTIEFEEDTLTFIWKDKLIFNYSDIEAISAKDIKIVIIDQDQFLRKIVTSDREIKISHGKPFIKDSQGFITLLSSIINQNGGRIIDSWDDWNEKGYLKWALRINTLIIIGITSVR